MLELQLIEEGIQDVPADLECRPGWHDGDHGDGGAGAYELAAKFRRRGIAVVLGGPHVTLIPEDAQPHADAIVTGYAEETWPELLRDFARRQGCSCGTVMCKVQNLKLENLPFPRRDLLPAKRYLTSNVFEATRGCVHNCDFCVVPAAWGRVPLQKPPEDVVADIRQMRASKALFVDLNIIADRAYAVRLFTALMPLKIKWYGLSTVLLGDDDELLELAGRSGCRGLLMGLESISPEALRQSRKGFNTPERFKVLVRKLHAHRIALQGCFVFGLDHDTPDVFLKTAQFAVEAKIDLPRFAVVTPFPGTGLYQRLRAEGRILTGNWELYDGQHVVFQPKQMSIGTVAERHRDGMEICVPLLIDCPPHHGESFGHSAGDHGKPRLSLLCASSEAVLHMRLVPAQGQGRAD